MIIVLKDTSRGRLLAYNTITSIFSQLATVVCNFVLTRLILVQFGSQTNGLVASISQFLGFISFLEMGIGAVVKSALYKPLAEHNYLDVSRVIISTKRFYRKIAIILIGYTTLLSVIFPIVFINQYSAFFTASLVAIISISLFAQYFFGMPYQLLLNADQHTYIPTVICCGTLIANTILSAILIHFNASIQVVKLTASIVYLIRPIFYFLYVRKKYPLNEKIELTEEPIKQKWNGLAQHIAYVVVNHTDIVVLTVLSTLANVSIYTVYHNVTIGVQQVISCVSVGFSSMLGNIMYQESKERLNETFGYVEWFFHFITVLLFTITGLLIIPFVKVYTLDVHDANYNVPIFAILIVLAQASYSIRTPYETMVLAANYFKKTQKSAIIEVVINICLSVLLVYQFGLVGVAIGTFAAMTYRTIYFVLFLKKHVLDYEIKRFIRFIVADIVQVGLCVFISWIIVGFSQFQLSWQGWILLAIQVCAICFVVCIVFNAMFFQKEFNSLLKKIKKTRT